MPTLSRIKLSNTVYDLQDTWARQALAGGLQFEICWDGQAEPDIAKIPAGVKVIYEGSTYTGTFPVTSAQPLTFYLVRSNRSTHEIDYYDEYAVIGTGNNKRWEKIGSTQVDFADLGTLAFKNSVSIVKGDGDIVLGASTTFTNAASAVSFTPATDAVLGADTTITAADSSVSFAAHTYGNALPDDTTLTVPAQNATVTNQQTGAFLTGVTAVTNKLVQQQFSNVSVTVGADHSEEPGGEDESDMLIISAANVTYAPGTVSSEGSGSDVMTGVTPASDNALTSIGTASVVQQTVTKATHNPIQAITALGAGTAAAQEITVNGDDPVTAYTGLSDVEAAAQTITVGTNDQVTVALYNDLDVSVS